MNLGYNLYEHTSNCPGVGRGLDVIAWDLFGRPRMLDDG